MVDAYITWDAAFSYRAVKNFALLFGVKNLLNQDPPVSRVAANFQVGYDAGLANPLGRQYRVSATYKF
jgi:iron complex outermembrane receptor protein